MSTEVIRNMEDTYWQAVSTAYDQRDADALFEAAINIKAFNEAVKSVEAKLGLKRG